jgi:hypothetical protein
VPDCLDCSGASLPSTLLNLSIFDVCSIVLFSTTTKKGLAVLIQTYCKDILTMRKVIEMELITSPKYMDKHAAKIYIVKSGGIDEEIGSHCAFVLLKIKPRLTHGLQEKVCQNNCIAGECQTNTI